MTINYLAVFVCAVLSMIIGSIWFGPLFGKMWMNICGADSADKTAREKMQKEAIPLYVIQFVLSIAMAVILSLYSRGLSVSVGIANALLIYIGFMLPLLAGGAMWNNNSNKIKWTEFLIQAGYYLVLIIVFSLVLTMWQ